MVNTTNSYKDENVDNVFEINNCNYKYWFKNNFL